MGPGHIEMSPEVTQLGQRGCTLPVIRSRREYEGSNGGEKAACRRGEVGAEQTESDGRTESLIGSRTHAWPLCVLRNSATISAEQTNYAPPNTRSNAAHMDLSCVQHTGRILMNDYTSMHGPQLARRIGYQQEGDAHGSGYGSAPHTELKQYSRHINRGQ